MAVVATPSRPFLVAATMSAEQPFTLAVPAEDIALLQQKLDLVRFPDELDGTGWDYGVPLADMKRLTAYWKDGFDWRKVEAEINNLPMFTRDIEVDGFGTLNIHYVHQKSDTKNAIPLLFVHGWPGHFLEVKKILPLLTAAGTAEHPSFHVVAPSLPAFGFSEAPKKPGFKGPQYAELLNKLMLSLGYNEYVYQGGDWGHIIGAFIVTHYGHKHVKAWHTNMPLVNKPSFFWNPLLFLDLFLLPFNKEAKEGLEATARFVTQGRGYAIEQATKPQTLGYSLADSPAGLLAWIYEKLVGWTDKYPWTDDEVLEWVSIYYFSRAGPLASTRIYYEMTGGAVHGVTDKGVKRMTVPVGTSYFPAELFRFPKSWVQQLGKLVFQSEHDKGGHFAAFEQPELLVGDLCKMYGRGGPAYGVVPGLSGYAS